MQMTVFIAMVIALLLFAFVVLINTHKRFGADKDFLIEAIVNVDKGIIHALNNNLILNDSVSVNIENEDFKTLKVYRDFWGVFEKVTSSSKIKNKEVAKVALIGGKQPRFKRTALYLKENKKPLVLVGNTRIQGTAYLPKRGVKTGNISGQSYYGNQLIYGNTKQSQNLPELVFDATQNPSKLESQLESISLDKFLDLNANKRHENSFYKPMKFVFSGNDILLSDISLIGHIIVKSKTKIIVEATASLKDIVLTAPIIEIRNNVIGTFQAIASKEITVGENCQLNYPSALVLKEKLSSDKKEDSGIHIKQHSFVKGFIMYLGNKKVKNNKAQVVIEKSSVVNGEIYCNQNLELKGAINGSVLTSNFIANQAGSIYQNHIYNGVINSDALPEEYVGLSFLNGQKGVMKWLY